MYHPCFLGTVAKLLRGVHAKFLKSEHKYPNTADFINKVLSVYIHSMTTIYLSLRAQSTFFMRSLVYKTDFCPSIHPFVHQPTKELERAGKGKKGMIEN